MRDMTPGIEANGEIERGGRKLEGVDVPMAKLRQMAEPVFARPHLGLCVADPDCALTDRELRERANRAEAFAKQAGRNCIATYRGGQLVDDELYVAAPVRK